MEMIEGIETRRSIRSFLDKPIPGETLKKILNAAANSPSYTNTQPWEVAVVCGEKKSALSDLLCNLVRGKAAARPDIAKFDAWPPAHEARMKEHGARRLAALGVARDDEEERAKLGLMNFKFYGAPCALFLFLDSSLREWSIFDMGLYTQNLILAAQANGLGTCLQASVTNYAPEIKTFLGMPEGKRLMICISMGYPDQDAKINAYRAVKQNPDEFVTWHGSGG